MPAGGRRPGAGRPKGATDDPLILARTLTNQQARTINEDAQVMRARTKLRAWEALWQRMENLDALPPKEQTTLLALALKFSADHTAVASERQPAGGSGPGSEVVWQRLEELRARQGLPPAAARPALSAVPDEQDPVDAELMPHPWAAEA
jgi:hypothetical protein